MVVEGGGDTFQVLVTSKLPVVTFGNFGGFIIDCILEHEKKSAGTASLLTSAVTKSKVQLVSASILAHLTS